MAEETVETKAEAVDAVLGEMKLEEGEAEVFLSVEINGNGPLAQDAPQPSQSPTTNRSNSPLSFVQTPRSENSMHEQLLDGEIALRIEPGKAPKLTRKSSQKVMSRPPPLFDHVLDSTEEAVATFQVIRDCIYGSKHMGSSEHDALGCDCSEEWGNGKNNACGEDSDCINRATKMECIDVECNCGSGCQNQRFQRKEFANVSVITTEKKGYGLRTDSDLQPNDFIFEYIGEVINEPTFRRRTIQYDDEGIKHFYFMSLTKSEFVDATKKGNLGRFCNHSCNPNCYVDKWVVGDKLRMGIFAERRIKAGEELVFNYNVDRYGADPQPCYCGEPNCTGFIGGKTQTERATKLSHATIEALGIDDGDGWDTAVAKKPRKKKMGEDDEEYVNNLQPRGLDEDGVTKVMATLMQCKEKWIAVKLLSRIQRCDDDRVRNRVVRMHGYQILRTTLTTWIDDNNVVLQILDILYKFPRLTRNKISDSKIDATIESLTSSEHEDVVFEASRLFEDWSKLEVAYRIPRKKFDPNAQPANQFDRRGGDREDEASKSPASTVVAPTGPRSGASHRNAANFAPARPAMIRRPFGPLPPGWFSATDESGNTYFYSKSGQTTWARPRAPPIEAPAAPKGPPKAIQNQKALQDIIDSLTKAGSSAHTPASSTPQRLEDMSRDKKIRTEKWRSYSIEKQMKLYENTLSPHVKYVMNKFRSKLSKEDLKKFAKEIGKNLVASDFKHNRVEDPTHITTEHEKKVRKFVKEFFDKVVAKKVAHEKTRVEKKPHSSTSGDTVKDTSSFPTSATVEVDTATTVKDEELGPQEMSDDAEDFGQAIQSAPGTPDLGTPSEGGVKRKRDDIGEFYDSQTSESPSKRFKEEDLESQPSPPPPPPPPPADEMVMDIDEYAELAAQEEALMRENEEALILENEEAMKDAKMLREELYKQIPESNDDADVKLNGIKTENSKSQDCQYDLTIKEVNGNTITKMEPSSGSTDSKDDVVHDLSAGIEENREQMHHERKEVLSH